MHKQKAARVSTRQPGHRPRVEELEGRLAPAGFTVTGLGDVVDSGDGVLTLREALLSAAANGSGTTDIIDFAVAGVINLDSTLPTLTNVHIDGPGADLLTIRRGSIDPTDPYRLLIVGGTDNRIAGVTLADGFTVGNTGSAAGAAIALSGDLTLGGVHVTDNQAGSEGGGVVIFDGNLTIIDSTFSGNSASHGGAIWIGQGTSTLTVENSTFSGNSASSNGGAIRLTGDESASLLNVTITGNSAGRGGGLALASQGELTMGNTLVAGNQSGDGPDISIVGSAAVTSLGGNLVGDNSGGVFTSLPGDQIGTGISPIDARLGPLTNNGGRTPTHALLLDSPALNAGNDAIALPVDQRGVPRPMDGQSDIGAYEVPLFVVDTLRDTIDGSDGVLTLREALLAAAGTAVTDTITFAVTGVISLKSTLPTLNNVHIEGPGADLLTIRRGSADPTDPYRLLIVGGTDNRIAGVTLADGFTVGNTGSAAGAAIALSGDLTLGGVHVTDNQAGSEGGGVVIFDGNLTIIDSTFSGNSASHGGAIWIGQGTSTLTVENSTFSGNSASSNGGAIRLTGDESASLLNVTITGNSAGRGGGLALASQGELTMGNTLVAGNQSGDGPDISIVGSAAVTSLGGNLVGDNSGGVFTSLPGDQIGTGISPIDARLGPLTNNGGRTPTHAILHDSPAVDRGQNGLLPTPFDQRGPSFPRLADSADADALQTVDVGAFERHPDIEDIGAQNILEDTPLTLVFNVGDGTALASVVATSGNTALVADASLQITGTGSTRTLQLTPAADQNGSALITITVTAANGEVVQDAFTLNVAAVNDAPTFALLLGDPPAINEGSGQQTVTGFAGNFQPGPPAAVDEALQQLAGYTVALQSSTGNLSFIALPSISTTGTLTYTPDPASFGSATFEVTAQDDGPGVLPDVNTSLARTFTIQVDNVPPTTPIDVDGAANEAAEGAAIGTLVGVTASSTDAIGVTYSLTDDAAGRFQIDADSGIVSVRDGALLDFESAPSHAITVQASDGAGGTSTQTFTIAVTNQAPSTPVDSDAAANSSVEGAAFNTPVGVTASSSDPNGPAVVFTLTDDAGGRFQIDSASGVVTVLDGTLLDFESAASHAITVQASDGAGGTSTQTFTIAVSNVAPSVPVDSNAAANTVAEGASVGTPVGITASSSDVNGPAVTYTLTDDAAGRFQIDSAIGVVTVLDGTLLDFETATSHAITVQSSDGAGGASTQTFTIAVTNVAPAVPVDSDAAANTVAEGASAGTPVGITASSSDVNGPDLTYKLSDDAGGRFQIDGASGVVTVLDGALLDVAAASSHTITVRASDGAGGSSTETFTINVSAARFTIVGATGSPTSVLAVKIFDSAGNLAGTVTPFNHLTALRVAAGDFDGDGRVDEFAVLGRRTSTDLRAEIVTYKVDKNGQAAETGRFFAFDPGILGNGFIAAGDFDGDGDDDIAVAQIGGGRTVVTLQIHVNNDGSFTRGASTNLDLGGIAAPRIGAGDTDADGFDEIVVAARTPNGARVLVLDGDTPALSQQGAGFTWDFGVAGYSRGAFVAVGEFDSTSAGAEIVLGSNVGGGGRVDIVRYDGVDTAALAANGRLTPFGVGYNAAVRVATGRLDERDLLVAGQDRWQAGQYTILARARENIETNPPFELLASITALTTADGLAPASPAGSRALGPFVALASRGHFAGVTGLLTPSAPVLFEGDPDDIDLALALLAERARVDSAELDELLAGVSQTKNT